MSDKFEQFLSACLLTPVGAEEYDVSDPMCLWGIPVNIIGGSGEGKSKRINAAARAVQLSLWTIYTSTKSPEHFAGVFVPTPDGEVVTMCGLPQVKAAMDAGGGIIFLDEISCAPGSVQAALLSFVQERQVGEYVLPSRTRIVLAMNPSDIAANGQDLEIPMANRMAHWNYQGVTVEQWGDYMLKRQKNDYINISEGEQKVKLRWNYHYPQVAALAYEFMMANNSQYEVRDPDDDSKKIKRSKLKDPPPPDDPRSSGPWPSPRTWTLATLGVTTVRCLELDPKLEIDMVESLVGKGLATEWAVFTAKMDLPSPEEAMSGKWKIPRRTDIVRTVINSAATFVVNRKDDQEKYEWAVKCWALLKKAVQAGNSDIIIKPLEQLVRNKLDIECENELVRESAEEVCDIINSSGIAEHVH